MARTPRALHELQMASPCSADWEQMKGKGRVRACHKCRLYVYRVSDLTREEAEEVIEDAEGAPRRSRSIQPARTAGGTTRSDRRRSYSLRRRCHWLTAVLTTTIAPMRMYFPSTGTWQKLTAFSSTPRISTPSSVPTTLPCPPDRLVPPMTTAAITFSSRPTCAAWSPLVLCAKTSTPAHPVSKPASVSISTL